VKRQFIQIQTSQEKAASGDAPSNASSNVSPSPKKNGSGLLSGYNAAASNAQHPQADSRAVRPSLDPVKPSSSQEKAGRQGSNPSDSRSKPAPPGSIGLPPRFTQTAGTQHLSPKSGPLFKGSHSSFASRAAAPAPQLPIQQPPNVFAPPNIPQQSVQVMSPQTRPIPNFERPRGYAGASPTTGGVPNYPGSPVAPAPAMPNAYRNTGNLALRTVPGETSAPRYLSPTGTPYTGFPPMQPMLGMRPPYPQYNPPPLSKSNRKRRFPIWARFVTAFTAFILLIAGGLFTYYQIEIAPTLNNIIGHGAIYHSSASNTSSKSGTPVAMVDAQNSNLSSQNRINILLLGSDTDGKNEAPLAQSDIIVTIDQQTHYVGMLSIPRDLQVSFPSGGAGKMDAAFSYGWQDQGGSNTTADVEAGAGLAEQTIQENFGIHIDRYAWVGLAGFVRVIDTAGGVDVDVTHPMVDDDYPDDVNNPGGDVYDYQRLYIAPGPQHLTGTEALDYVRTRHSDLIGDFGRSARQQQVLAALKARLATPDTLSQTPQLLQDVNGYLLTDMQLDDLAFLGNLARTINLNNVQHVTLSPPYSTASTVNTNYLPVCSQIMPILSQMFGIQANCIPQSSGSAGLASIIQPLPHSNNAVTSQGTQNSQPFPSQTQGSDLSSMNIVGDVHTLLDLMLVTVFESFDAIKV
jgi:LCP family protein required for cell wall assembly